MSITKGEPQHSAAAAAARIGFEIPVDHVEDYDGLLAKTDAACAAILAEEGEQISSICLDYVPPPNVEAYPRINVRLPQGEANPLKAWAWRADVGDSIDSTGKILSGKTVVLKDTVCLAEVPLRFGTDAFDGYTPLVDATVVTRILEHGGHILGKAACENFSHGATSSSSPFGPVENPFARGFTTGGSSSGCGGLIGSGEADMGIGGDQGGSIRIPASFCGIVGLKPTFGLVPYTGVLSSDSGLDHVGPMARTVLDTARLLQATAGYDDIDDRQLGAPRPPDVPDYVNIVLQSRPNGIRGAKIGVLKEAFLSKHLAPSVDHLVKAAIQRFSDLGAIVQEVSVPTFPLTPMLSHVVNKFASGGTRQGRQVGRKGLYLNDYWEQLLPWTPDKYHKAKYFVSGTAMSCEYGWTKYPTAYGKAMNLSRRMRDEFDRIFENFDAVICPTCPQPPRRHIPEGAGPLLWAEHAPGTASFTAAGNLTGHPAISIPVGFASPMEEDIRRQEDTELLLPVGMMLTGKCFDEATLLKLGDAWEQSVNWRDIRSF